MESDCTALAIQAVVAELNRLAHRARSGEPTIITVVVATPGDPNYQVISPPTQNPAATYGVLRDVVRRTDVHFALDRG